MNDDVAVLDQALVSDAVDHHAGFGGSPAGAGPDVPTRTTEVYMATLGVHSLSMGVLVQRPNLSADPPSIHYSVDLTFRFLPDVVKQARTASEQDPLGEHLLQLARQWPLSSVGVAGVADVNVDAIVGHPCLLRMYADRIIATRDWTRLIAPRVREAVQCAVGLSSELAPGFPEEEPT